MSAPKLNNKQFRCRSNLRRASSLNPSPNRTNIKSLFLVNVSLSPPPSLRAWVCVLLRVCLCYLMSSCCSHPASQSGIGQSVSTPLVSVVSSVLVCFVRHECVRSAGSVVPRAFGCPPLSVSSFSRPHVSPRSLARLGVLLAARAAVAGGAVLLMVIAVAVLPVLLLLVLVLGVRLRLFLLVRLLLADLAVLLLRPLAHVRNQRPLLLLLAERARLLLAGLGALQFFCADGKGRYRHCISFSLPQRQCLVYIVYANGSKCKLLLDCSLWHLDSEMRKPACR